MTLRMCELSRLLQYLTSMAHEMSAKPFPADVQLDLSTPVRLPGSTLLLA